MIHSLARGLLQARCLLYTRPRNLEGYRRSPWMDNIILSRDCTLERSRELQSGEKLNSTKVALVV